MKSSYFIGFFVTVFVLKTNAWTFRALLYSDWITCDHNKSLDLDVSKVQVYFYDFKNNVNMTHQIDGAVAHFTSFYNLDISKRLIFYVPGYKSNINKPNDELVRQTFRDVPDTYLVMIDHSAYTSAEGGRIKSYERSVLYSYYIGRALGKVLVEFHEKGIPSGNIHCIGHSLGSQILGVAGKDYVRLTGQKLWRITGIDPAGPCFSNSLIEEQLNSGAADYVEVYHCNAGGLGTTSVLAHADFFLNKGTSEPECKGSFIPGKAESDKAKCSHKKCLMYYMKTVHEPGWYLAWKCDSYKKHSEGKCARNEVAIAGYHNPGNATGVFYASTEAHGVV